MVNKDEYIKLPVVTSSRPSVTSSQNPLLVTRTAPKTWGSGI